MVVVFKKNAGCVVQDEWVSDEPAKKIVDGLEIWRDAGRPDSKYNKIVIVMMHNGDRADQPLASLSCRHPASRTRTSLTAKHLIIIHHPSYLHLIHPTTSTTYYHPSLSPLLSSSHPEISTTKLPSTMEALYRMSESTASASRSAATQVGGHGGVMSDASGSIVMKVGMNEKPPLTS
jgi:hypothetical protein